MNISCHMNRKLETENNLWKLWNFINEKYIKQCIDHFLLWILPIYFRVTSMHQFQQNNSDWYGWIDPLLSWLYNHNKSKHRKTMCIFYGTYCIIQRVIITLYHYKRLTVDSIMKFYSIMTQALVTSINPTLTVETTSSTAGITGESQRIYDLGGNGRCW